MWPSYIHHLALHFPIALSVVLAGLSVWVLRTDSADGWSMVRAVGALAWVLTTITVVSGALAAEQFWTAEGPDILLHHRNLGILGWACTTVGAGAVVYGLKNTEPKVARFGAVMWIAVAFAMIGAGHWGGSGVHSDLVPWQGEPPVIHHSPSVEP